MFNNNILNTVQVVLLFYIVLARPRITQNLKSAKDNSKPDLATVKAGAETSPATSETSKLYANKLNNVNPSKCKASPVTMDQSSAASKLSVAKAGSVVASSVSANTILDNCDTNSETAPRDMPQTDSDERIFSPDTAARDGQLKQQQRQLLLQNALDQRYKRVLRTLICFANYVRLLNYLRNLEKYLKEQQCNGIWKRIGQRVEIMAAEQLHEFEKEKNKIMNMYERCNEINNRLAMLHCYKMAGQMLVNSTLPLLKVSVQKAEKLKGLQYLLAENTETVCHVLYQSVILPKINAVVALLKDCIEKYALKAAKIGKVDAERPATEAANVADQDVLNKCSSNDNKYENLVEKSAYVVSNLAQPHGSASRNAFNAADVVFVYTANTSSSTNATNTNNTSHGFETSNDFNGSVDTNSSSECTAAVAPNVPSVPYDLPTENSSSVSVTYTLNNNHSLNDVPIINIFDDHNLTDTFEYYEPGRRRNVSITPLVYATNLLERMFAEPAIDVEEQYRILVTIFTMTIGVLATMAILFSVITLIDDDDTFLAYTAMNE